MATFIAPTTAPPYDEALGDIIQATIVGITGLVGELVRPRWQTEPANQPDFNTNWVAFGLTTIARDRYAAMIHDGTGNGGLGSSALERDETLKLLLSFYGPQGTAIMERFVDGIQIDQNRDALLAAGIKLVETQDSINLPALMKEKWVQRVDLGVLLTRRTSRTYNVPSIVGGTLGLDNEYYLTEITVSN